MTCTVVVRASEPEVPVTVAVNVPDCRTVKVWPAMVRVPVRELPGLLAATEKFTVSLKVPLLPEVMVIKAALLVAVQLQVLPKAVTVTLPAPAAELNVWVVGVIVKEHGGGPPPQATCNARKPTRRARGK